MKYMKFFFTISMDALHGLEFSTELCLAPTIVQLLRLHTFDLETEFCQYTETVMFHYILSFFWSAMQVKSTTRQFHSD